MAVERRIIWLASALAVTVVASLLWTSGGSTPARTPIPARAAPPSPQAAAADPGEPEQVNLAALKVEREEPGNATRNPFRFEPRVAAPTAQPPPATSVNQEGSTPSVPVAPTGPPPPPPITLKFIGIVTQGNKRVAVLSDGRSPIGGQEGDIILGQYRILKIGNESIDMAYLDGRGRQTIRLTGQ